MSVATMKIGLVVRSLRGGGLERVVVTLANGFAARGHRTTLLVGVRQGATVRELSANVHLLPLQASSHLTARAWALCRDRHPLRFTLPLVGPASPRMLRRLPALVHHLQTEKEDVLLAAGTQSNLVALWARRIADPAVKVAVSEHNVLSVVARHAKHAFRRVYPALVGLDYPSADAIITVSEGVADDLARTAGLDRRRIITIRNPVVSPDLLENARAPVDHPWLAKPGPLVIIAVGRLHRQKDFPTLIRAFARVRAVRRARLIILGEGEERARLEGLVRASNLVDDVYLPGFVPNPFAWMSRASVFVQSSAWEGSGNALVEAMACGCPVVSTDCTSGPAEILDAGRYGPLVPVGDDDALAGAILSALREPVAPDRLRSRATMFDRDAAVDRYLEVLAETLQ